MEKKKDFLGMVVNKRGLYESNHRAVRMVGRKKRKRDRTRFSVTPGRRSISKKKGRYREKGGRDEKQKQGKKKRARRKGPPVRLLRIGPSRETARAHRKEEAYPSPQWEERERKKL